MKIEKTLLLEFDSHEDFIKKEFLLHALSKEMKKELFINPYYVKKIVFDCKQLVDNLYLSYKHQRNNPPAYLKKTKLWLENIK